ncbi:hypothetical protein LTR70_003806 [Exophiala xenobiotica]|nr:hypothetical protein LTR70_003806 [Exophiala xenobiotica]
MAFAKTTYDAAGLAVAAIACRTASEDPRYPAEPCQAHQATPQAKPSVGQLYSEGHTILYNKNVVAIRIADVEQGGKLRDHTSTLKTCVQLGFRFPKAPMEHMDLLDAMDAEDQRKALSRCLDAEYFAQLFPALRKVRNFKVHIEYEDQDDIFVQCRVPRALLDNKHVTFVLEPEAVAKGHTISWLKSCRVLRCSSISFYKLNDTQFLEDLRETITSRTVVRDTFLPWMNYQRNIAPLLRGHTHSAFKNEYKEEFKELKQHMLKYDLDAYIVQQKYLVERAIQWNQLCAEAECQKLMDQVNQKNRVITAALEADVPCSKH